MRWEGRRQSGNIEDRRGMSPRGVAVGGGGVGLLLLLLFVMCMGGDPQQVIQQLPQPQAEVQPAPKGAPTAAEDEMGQFISVVLGDTEDVWRQQFQQLGKTYREPTLVMFTGQVQSACGFQSAAVGPFYCPLDEKVYVDLAFYEEMKTKLGSPGDFAQAYVIAHEVGHHVQKLLGISDQVQQLQARNPQAANDLSVRVELQADFFAGVWAHHAERNWQILEEGDVREALNAATQIGDDRLQMKTRGFVVPESFTHGTSEQRARWFLLGLKTGDMEQGDTFSADPL